MGQRLRFRFDLEKCIQALAYFSTHGIGNLTKLKAAKLLYLADQYHLFHYGRPVLGDRYIAMEYGPVPESAFQILGQIEATRPEVEDSVRQHALAHLSVTKGLWQRYPVIRARGAVDLSVFSDSDIEALDYVVREFGTRTARDLVALTHRHAAYRRADAGRSPGSSVELPYEYFFDDAPADLREQALQLAASEQEDRDYSDALREAGAQALAARQPASTPR